MYFLYYHNFGIILNDQLITELRSFKLSMLTIIKEGILFYSKQITLSKVKTGIKKWTEVHSAWRPYEPTFFLQRKNSKLNAHHSMDTYIFITEDGNVKHTKINSTVIKAVTSNKD